MKKILLVAFIFSFLALGQAQGAGLVPCGGEGEPACSFCCFFVMINNIVQFVVIKMVPAIAALMLAIGGIMFFFAGGSPGTLGTAKNIMTSAVIGMVIVFAAFLLIGTVLSALGLTGWTEDFYRNWWQEGFFQIPGCSGCQ